MPISKKSPTTPKSTPIGLTPRPLTERVRDLLPRRIVIVVVVRDESGSMRRWRQRQGEFTPAVAAHLIEVGGPKVGDVVYMLYCVVSGGVVATEFVPIAKATDPEFSPDGMTPLGKAFSTVSAKIEGFFEAAVFPQEVTVRNLECLVISDLKATGESAEETEAGVRTFLAMLEKYRGKVQIVGPDLQSMNDDLASRLDVSKRGIKYLDADPKSVLTISFDSFLNASRPIVGGSDPNVGLK